MKPVKTKPGKESSHNLARKRLLTVMAELSAAGESRLPGLRKLCGELDVSFMTVNKVIKRLTLEGRIKSIAKKGNYITVGPHPHNIGLILSNEHDPSFLGSPRTMEAILHVLGKNTCSIRLLPTPPDRAGAVIDEKMLDAAIWYLPAAKEVSMVRDAIATMDIPVLPVFQDWTGLDPSELPACHVTTDAFRGGWQRVEFLLKRGHRRIARFNISSQPELHHDTPFFEGFQAAINDYGGRHELEAWSVLEKDLAEKIPALLEEGEVTAATVNGNETSVRKLFVALSSHKRASAIELVLPDIGFALATLMAEFPKVKVAGVNCSSGYSLGTAAAEMLVAHLNHGLPLGVAKVFEEIRER